MTIMLIYTYVTLDNVIIINTISFIITRKTNLEIPNYLFSHWSFDFQISIKYQSLPITKTSKSTFLIRNLKSLYELLKKKEQRYFNCRSEIITFICFIYCYSMCSQLANAKISSWSPIVPHSRLARIQTAVNQGFFV